MTAAQKTAKAKFKQAIAYRQKTGVSLKEAFAHVYGKKVGVAPKKKATKKAAKKVVKKAAPKKAAKKHTKYGVVKKHVRRVAGVKKRKPISEQSVLNKIHKVKDQVNQLDELQHKHMIGRIIKSTKFYI
jgi:adenylate kinase